MYIYIYICSDIKKLRNKFSSISLWPFSWSWGTPGRGERGSSLTWDHQTCTCILLESAFANIALIVSLPCIWLTGNWSYIVFLYLANGALLIHWIFGLGHWAFGVTVDRCVLKWCQHRSLLPCWWFCSRPTWYITRFIIFYEEASFWGGLLQRRRSPAEEASFWVGLLRYWDCLLQHI